jgi:hypothetical protein
MKKIRFAAFLCWVLLTMGLSLSCSHQSQTNATNAKNRVERKIASIPLALPRDYSEEEVFSVISEPSLLRILEQRSNLKFSEILEGPNFLSASTSDLAKDSLLYQSFVEELKNDLKETLRKELLHKKNIGVGMMHDRRLFNEEWLHSPLSRYELVGIVNRLDRVAFSRNKDENESGSDLIPNSKSTCGEIRFIYRLAYQLPTYQGIVKKNADDHLSSATQAGLIDLYSRLPMTVNAVFWVKNIDGTWNSCKRFVKAWKYPKVKDAEELTNWMLSNEGPISNSIFDRSLLKSIEVNLQASRTPSTIRSDMGGQAEYLLRAFRKKDSKLVPGPLEGTPNVALLQKNPELKKELLNFIRHPHNAGRLDAGILLLPDRFLATKASSFSPYASARLANRPFDQLFTAKDFEGIKLLKPVYLSSSHSYLKRLNDMSCAGCHQGSATAGFHFLGMDYPETHIVNSLVFEGSGHFALELVRRKKYLERVDRDLIPTPHRPFSVSPSEIKTGIFSPALIGQSCGLKGSGFENWTCESGASCVLLDSGEGEKEWGRCVPDDTQAGDPCLMGPVLQTADYNKDRIKDSKTIACGKGSSRYSCMTYQSGFPGGMCTGKKEHPPRSREILGHFAGTGFSTCLGQEGRSFEDCFNLTTDYNLRGICDVNRPCRPDYVCVRTPLAKNGEGACTPSYFMFQLRIDGHPTPMGTRLKDMNGLEKGI